MGMTVHTTPDTGGQTLENATPVGYFASQRPNPDHEIMTHTLTKQLVSLSGYSLSFIGQKGHPVLQTDDNTEGEWT